MPLPTSHVSHRPFQPDIGPQDSKTGWAHSVGTRHYGEIAEQVGAPGAARAVGLANGHNPIAIIVPCHRVIGASGRLTGYGGGLDRKRSLLALETSSATLPLFD